MQVGARHNLFRRKVLLTEQFEQAHVARQIRTKTAHNPMP